MSTETRVASIVRVAYSVLSRDRNITEAIQAVRVRGHHCFEEDGRIYISHNKISDQSKQYTLKRLPDMEYHTVIPGAIESEKWDYS